MPITVDQASLDRTFAALSHIKNGAPLAITRALNTGATKSKTIVSRTIREQVRLPARYVNDRIKLTRATYARQLASVSTPYRGILLSYYLVQSASQPLARYDPKLGRMVVSAPTGDNLLKTRIKPTGNVTTWRHAFLLRLKYSGQLGMAQRREELGPLGGKLQVLHGPSLSQVFNESKDEIADPEAADIVAAELDRQVQLLLGEI